MKKIIIAAKSDNNVIGKDGDLPWHLPADLEHFNNLIRDGYIIFGRKTYESPQGKDIIELGKKFVVITRQKNYKVLEKVTVASTLEAAYQCALADEAAEVLVLGGAAIYQQAMNEVDVLIITEIHAQLEGDSFFPDIDPTIWKEVQRQDFPSDVQNPYPYSFVEYRRR